MLTFSSKATQVVVSTAAAALAPEEKAAFTAAPPGPGPPPCRAGADAADAIVFNKFKWSTVRDYRS